MFSIKELYSTHKKNSRKVQTRKVSPLNLLRFITGRPRLIQNGSVARFSLQKSFEKKSN